MTSYLADEQTEAIADAPFVMADLAEWRQNVVYTFYRSRPDPCTSLCRALKQRPERGEQPAPPTNLEQVNYAILPRSCLKEKKKKKKKKSHAQIDDRRKLSENRRRT